MLTGLMPPVFGHTRIHDHRGQHPNPTSERASSQAGLKSRHLSMIAIGGVIGAGLFVGSGSGIGRRRPSSHPSFPTGSSASLVAPRDADARRDGRGQPDPPVRSPPRVTAHSGSWAGFTNRLAVLVLLGRWCSPSRRPPGPRSGRAGSRRCPRWGLGPDRHDRPHRHQPGLRQAPTASSSSGSPAIRSRLSPRSS